MHAVRKRILELLKELGAATVAELAERLEMAPVSVRHHLDILQGDNLICVDRLQRKGSVGRPQQIYALTDEACRHFPNDFATLANNLVRQIKQILPQNQVDQAFESMAHHLAGEFKEGQPANLAFESYLDLVVDFLNEHGYLARWEAAGSTLQEGYLLHKHNCPYAGVSTEHSELCCMDLTLVNDLLDQPCTRTRSMVGDGHSCTYHFGADPQHTAEIACQEIKLVGNEIA